MDESGLTIEELWRVYSYEVRQAVAILRRDERGSIGRTSNQRGFSGDVK